MTLYSGDESHGDDVTSGFDDSWSVENWNDHYADENGETE